MTVQQAEHVLSLGIRLLGRPCVVLATQPNSHELHISKTFLRPITLNSPSACLLAYPLAQTHTRTHAHVYSTCSASSRSCVTPLPCSTRAAYRYCKTRISIVPRCVRLCACVMCVHVCMCADSRRVCKPVTRSGPGQRPACTMKTLAPRSVRHATDHHSPTPTHRHQSPTATHRHCISQAVRAAVATGRRLLACAPSC